jgi:homoserine kinase
LHRRGRYRLTDPLRCQCCRIHNNWIVRVPASSANLGSGFDALAVALGIYLEVSDSGDQPESETHPAVRAFRGAGGDGPLFVRSAIAGGRGLGFSGAARVAGLLAARVQRGQSRSEGLLRAASELEGHADNVAASIRGGVVAVASGRVVRIPLGADLAVVVWIPTRETATASAGRLLPEQVPFADAAFNVSRAALLVAALAAGDTDALRIGTEDRLHQDRRLARAPESHHAIDAALDAGAFAAWLSGSGPSVAAFVDPGRTGVVAAALPAGGRALVLAVDDAGASVHEA